jgi:hypothetical protein
MLASLARNARHRRIVSTGTLPIVRYLIVARFGPVRFTRFNGTPLEVARLCSLVTSSLFALRWSSCIPLRVCSVRRVPIRSRTHTVPAFNCLPLFLHHQLKI